MGFEFPLLSDPDHTAGRLLDVEREPEERGFGVPRRVTYLVDPDGVIRESYLVPRDELDLHAQTVLEDVRRLRAA